MGKSWLMCVLLGTLAWGQAAPSAPPPPQPAQAPVDTSASVPADAAVITVIGVCPAQPKPAAAKGTAAKPATAAKTPAAKTPAADCKTVITKAQFEKLASAVAPSLTPQVKKQLAGVLPRFIGMSSEAKKEGLDKTEQLSRQLKFAKMQILTTELQRKIQEEAAKISPADIEKYYKEHADTFEQFNVDRLFVPRTKQADAESKEEDEKDEKLSDEAKKAKEAEEKAKADEAEQAMTKLAESLRARAAAGEDIVKLQKEAFEAAGMKIESPTVNLPNVRRTGLSPAHAAVFDLKARRGFAGDQRCRRALHLQIEQQRPPHARTGNERNPQQVAKRSHARNDGESEQLVQGGNQRRILWSGRSGRGATSAASASDANASDSAGSRGIGTTPPAAQPQTPPPAAKPN